MKKFSIILSALGVIVLLFDRLARVQHWVSDYSKTVSDVMSTLDMHVGIDPLNGLPLLGFIILALAAFLYNTADKNALYPAAGVTLLMIVIGQMFKILHWPGAGLILVLSYAVLMVVIVPWLTLVILSHPGPENVVDDPLRKEAQTNADLP